MHDSDWEPDGLTAHVRFCEGGGPYHANGIPAATLQRVIGTIRRECLDWMIPLSEAHLRATLVEWLNHYNQGRPHSELGPGVPDPPKSLAVFPKFKSRHRLAAGVFVRVKSVLQGPHHEYSLATV